MSNPKGWLELGLMYHPKPKDRGLELVGGEASYEKFIRKCIVCYAGLSQQRLTGVIQSPPLADTGEGEISANRNFLYKMKMSPLFLALFLCLLI